MAFSVEIQSSHSRQKCETQNNNVNSIEKNKQHKFEKSRGNNYEDLANIPQEHTKQTTARTNRVEQDNTIKYEPAEQTIYEYEEDINNVNKDKEKFLKNSVQLFEEFARSANSNPTTAAETKDIIDYFAIINKLRSSNYLSRAFGRELLISCIEKQKRNNFYAEWSKPSKQEQSYFDKDTAKPEYNEQNINNKCTTSLFTLHAPITALSERELASQARFKQQFANFEESKKVAKNANSYDFGNIEYIDRHRLYVELLKYLDDDDNNNNIIAVTNKDTCLNGWNPVDKYGSNPSGYEWSNANAYCCYS